MNVRVPLIYRADLIDALYRALQSVNGVEAKTPEGRARIVKDFEVALINECGGLVVVDIPQDILDDCARQLRGDA